MGSDPVEYGLAASLGSAETKASLDAVRQGLREHGYVEGQNIQIEYRSADGNIERFPGLATELASLKVDLIVAGATPAGRAAKAATAMIPIIVMAMGDPVGDGLVASLARPGGNLTGTTFLGPALVPKHLALLKEALPRATLIAILWQPDAFADSTMRDLLKEAEAAARTLRVQLRFAEIRRPEELNSAFSTIVREHPDALLVFPSTMLFNERARIVALAARHRLPSVFNNRQAVELGGLMSYGTSIPELLRRTGTYIDKILKGARPADLPVEQPTKFELLINLTTAKALGVTVPQSLLLRADQLID
ncbi:MAG TPA: ABC transporter substrate-binding protein [Methylomirabilota bacterium]|nr:ABC transporter substrate-binding protein [Methylomirabilota bacterium]